MSVVEKKTALTATTSTAPAAQHQRSTSHSSSGGGAEVYSPTTAAPAVATTNIQKDETSTPASSSSEQPLDFVGSARVFKDLFSLSQQHDIQDGRPLSIAVHNLGGGTLLLDHEQQHESVVDSTDKEEDKDSQSQRHQLSNNVPRGELPSLQAAEESKDEDGGQVVGHEDGLLPLVALSSSSLGTSSEESETALALVNSWINDTSKSGRRRLEPHEHEDSGAWIQAPTDGQLQADDSVCTLNRPTPDDYVFKGFTDSAPSSSPYREPPPPREYLSWQFQDINLLVGSDALVYRAPSSLSNPSSTTTTSTALTLRVEDAHDLKALFEKHQELAQLARHKQTPLSYVEAARSQPHRLKQSDSEDATTESAESLPAVSTTNSSPPPSLGAPNVLSAGGKKVLVEPVAPLPESSGDDTGSNTTVEASPVSLVLDAYLDNIMANVPQLALCLREKGYIQSVKLLQTADIPVGMMHPSTLDTSSPFGVFQGSSEMEKMFSPRIMEMNASALLRFLQSNCRTENSTYLLRREAGETNLRLYDISSISAHGQHKWLWWLATMSYRFALRLRHLSRVTEDSAHARTFRDRQRSLLQNTLDLLEVLTDMDVDGDGRAAGDAVTVHHHESLMAAIQENLADTFLDGGERRPQHHEVVETQQRQNDGSNTNSPAPAPAPVSDGVPDLVSFVSSNRPYAGSTADALNKAHDHLLSGIQILWPVLESHLPKGKKMSKDVKDGNVELSMVETIDSDSEDSDDEEISERAKAKSQSNSKRLMEIDAVGTQLFGLHQKLINVSLRLAEIHLKNYWSSSAMQALRTAARRIAASLYLIQLLTSNDKGRQDELSDWLRSTQLQYTWLWEHCGHFARSFAADVHWRDRGHASGDDICAVLRDVQRAFAEHDVAVDVSLPFYRSIRPGRDPIARKSNGMVTLDTLNPVIGFQNTDSILNVQESVQQHEAAVKAARDLLEKQRMLQKDQRRVLCASCIAYSRSIQAYKDLTDSDPGTCDLAVLNLLQKRLGDACNETGNVLLNELRSLLGSTPSNETGGSDEKPVNAAGPLLSSAEFWFLQGLEAFEGCKDLANLALLRCNLCQCYKLRANAMFENAIPSTDGQTHAERCLSQAIHHLEAAHVTLGEREASPRTWDMVSAELAATLLLLGVRRRQSLIGSGNIPVIAQALRLSPGKERSIVDPMEQALRIFEELKNFQQAAAVHYQLALFFSKIWTCQRDEAKTREKLSAAFQHYASAYGFFANNVQGNETTFCLLCLDMASLYTTVSGAECLSKALLRCLDTVEVFAEETLNRMLEAQPNRSSRAELLEKMNTLAGTVEDRVFKLLRSLTKVEEGADGSSNDASTAKYKELYRVGLQSKIKGGTVQLTMPTGEAELDDKLLKLVSVHHVVQAIQAELASST